VLFDNSGNVVERYIYDPFGQATVLDTDWTERSGSAFAWVYLHQGGRFDTTSGLYHFRHRDYSPTLGRWTSLDPLGFAAGDVNLYRVVYNQPVLLTDAYGLFPPDSLISQYHSYISSSLAAQNAMAASLTGYNDDSYNYTLSSLAAQKALTAGLTSFGGSQRQHWADQLVSLMPNWMVEQIAGSSNDGFAKVSNFSPAWPTRSAWGRPVECVGGSITTMWLITTPGPTRADKSLARGSTSDWRLPTPAR